MWWIGTSLGIQLNRWQYEIGLLAGISFFTFIATTYVIDIYRKNMEPHCAPQDVFLFIGFFPQKLSGPINRVVQMMAQLKQRVRVSALEFESGPVQFGLGMIKRIAISDQMAPHVNMIFAAPAGYDGLTLLQGLLGYTIQIYCDFSGYSDMAIGCARMMGFRFAENFQMPHRAVNITEFWRRWHIFLSTWFRDFLYVPLGGNRKRLTRPYANLMLTKLLCGLWHGASWNFVFWGGLHGTGLATHRAWKRLAFPVSLKDLPGFRLLSNLFSRVLTLGVVGIGRLFFRSDSWSNATQYLSRLVTWSGGGTRMLSPYIIAAVAGTEG